MKQGFVFPPGVVGYEDLLFDSTLITLIYFSVTALEDTRENVISIIILDMLAVDTVTYLHVLS